MKNCTHNPENSKGAAAPFHPKGIPHPGAGNAQSRRAPEAPAAQESYAKLQSIGM